MDIHDVLETLSDDERLLIEDYIEAAVESDLEEQLYWIEQDHATDVEYAVHDALVEYEQENRFDMWPRHNELGHFGGVEMCDQIPCNLF